MELLLQKEALSMLRFLYICVRQIFFIAYDFLIFLSSFFNYFTYFYFTLFCISILSSDFYFVFFTYKNLLSFRIRQIFTSEYPQFDF